MNDKADVIVDPAAITDTSALLDTSSTDTARVLQQGGDVVIDDPGMDVRCATPGDLGRLLHPDLRSGYRSALGTFAERLINQDYCAQTKCQPFLQPNSEGTDFFDNPMGATLLIAFLSFHNPALTQDEIATMSKMREVKDGLRRPDLVTHKPERQEFYEIKPASGSGLGAGRRKIKRLRTFFEGFDLPYIVGRAYTPTPEIRIATVTIDGIPIEVFLRVKREQAALLSYRFCIRGDLAEASIRAGKKVRKLALLGFIIGVIIPIDDPIPSPAPEPVPAGGEAQRNIEVTYPKPYSGTTDEDFTFWYVSGLPRSHKKGRKFPIVIAYLSNGQKLRTVIEFRVTSVSGNVTKLKSTNNVALNIAPRGHRPLVIKVHNELTVTWS